MEQLEHGTLFEYKSYKSYQKWQFGQWLIGLSQPADNILSNKVSYDIAPEIFKGTAFSKNSDVYSMGMVMWELTSGYKPFANIEHNTSLIDDIINGTRPEITDDTPDCFGNLIKSCWHYNPTDRPSISDICKTIDDWLIMEKNVELFSLAEEKRLESIQLEKLNTESTNKCYSKVDCNKSLKSLISGSLSFSMNLFNMKLEHSLRELEKNDIQSSSSEYVTNTLILSKNPSSKHSIEDEIQNNAKLGRNAEANDSFSRAEIRLPKAWAAWGLYNNAKSRKLLIRILWLLSLEDLQSHISRVFEIYNSKSVDSVAARLCD
ncbi:3135_t:CDS:2 [Rhizophagus irregularis]|nr:3135_t:CDS:2 [Rhizophagus irregularis]